MNVTQTSGEYPIFTNPFDAQSYARAVMFERNLATAEVRRGETFSSDRDLQDVELGKIIYPYFAETEFVQETRASLSDQNGRLQNINNRVDFG